MIGKGSAAQGILGGYDTANGNIACDWLPLKEGTRMCVRLACDLMAVVEVKSGG